MIGMHVPDLVGTLERALPWLKLREEGQPDAFRALWELRKLTIACLGCI